MNTDSIEIGKAAASNSPAVHLALGKDAIISKDDQKLAIPTWRHRATHDLSSVPGHTPRSTGALVADWVLYLCG